MRMRRKTFVTARYTWKYYMRICGVLPSVCKRDQAIMKLGKWRLLAVYVTEDKQTTSRKSTFPKPTR
jgi:hypothetical protein